MTLHRRFLFPLISPLAFCSAAAAAAIDIHDIRAPLQPDSLPPFALSIACLALAGGVALCWSRSRSGNPRSASAAPDACRDPAWELELLARSLERGELTPDALAETLAWLLREFMEGTAGMPASRLTTEELLAAPPLADFRGLDELAELLKWCDRVKFAAYAPAPGEGGRALESARKVLERFGEVGRTVPEHFEEVRRGAA